MIGGGVLAYTMIGIAVNEENINDTEFLIMDPHYVGKNDWKSVLKTKNGGVYWKSAKLFGAKNFYNFCCPIPN